MRGRFLVKCWFSIGFTIESALILNTFLVICYTFLVISVQIPSFTLFETRFRQIRRAAQWNGCNFTYFFGASGAISGPEFLQRPSLRVWPVQPKVNFFNIGLAELGAPIWIINYLGRPRNIFLVLPELEITPPSFHGFDFSPAGWPRKTRRGGFYFAHD